MMNKKGRSGNPAKRAEQNKQAESGKGVAIYHDMLADEGFDDTAERLLQMVSKCARDFPGKPRHLYLDVEKHRNEVGGFDQDAEELMTNFIVGFLMPWLSECSTPLGAFRNSNQREDVPDSLMIMEGGEHAEREGTLRKHAEALGEPIYDSETGEMVDADGNRTRNRG